MRQYIEKAIALGIDVYGFSDHAPMEYDKKYRMDFDAMQGYFDEIESLQKEYADQITILKALEVDYLPGYMDERVLNADVDYFIGSVHFLNGWGFDNPEFIGGYKDKDIDLIYSEYFSAIEQMAQSKLFDVVGHLDLIKVFGYKPRGDVTKIAQNALEAIACNNMVIEINAAGFRKPVQEAYPSLELLRLARRMGIAITFGSDAHGVEQVGFAYDRCVKLAKAAGYERCVSFQKRNQEVVIF
jgi:histidinol-phosphatase (PHP family)